MGKKTKEMQFPIVWNYSYVHGGDLFQVRNQELDRGRCVCVCVCMRM